MTAAAPNTIAASIATARAGRANGRDRPSVTDLGNGSREARAAARRPRAGPPVRPTASASTVRSRPARHALAHAVTATTTSAAATTTTLTSGSTAAVAAP